MVKDGIERCRRLLRLIDMWFAGALFGFVASHCCYLLARVTSHSCKHLPHAAKVGTETTVRAKEYHNYRFEKTPPFRLNLNLNLKSGRCVLEPDLQEVLRNMEDVLASLQSATTGMCTFSNHHQLQHFKTGDIPVAAAVGEHRTDENGETVAVRELSSFARQIREKVANAKPSEDEDPDDTPSIVQHSLAENANFRSLKVALVNSLKSAYQHCSDTISWKNGPFERVLQSINVETRPPNVYKPPPVEPAADDPELQAASLSQSHASFSMMLAMAATGAGIGSPSAQAIAAMGAFGGVLPPIGPTLGALPLTNLSQGPAPPVSSRGTRAAAAAAAAAGTPTTGPVIARRPSGMGGHGGGGDADSASGVGGGGGGEATTTTPPPDLEVEDSTGSSGGGTTTTSSSGSSTGFGGSNTSNAGAAITISVTVNGGSINGPSGVISVPGMTGTASTIAGSTTSTTSTTSNGSGSSVVGGADNGSIAGGAASSAAASAAGTGNGSGLGGGDGSGVMSGIGGSVNGGGGTGGDSPTDADGGGAAAAAAAPVGSGVSIVISDGGNGGGTVVLPAFSSNAAPAAGPPANGTAAGNTVATITVPVLNVAPVSPRLSKQITDHRGKGERSSASLESKSLSMALSSTSLPEKRNHRALTFASEVAVAPSEPDRPDDPLPDVFFAERFELVDKELRKIAHHDASMNFGIFLLHNEQLKKRLQAALETAMNSLKNELQQCITLWTKDAFEEVVTQRWKVPWRVYSLEMMFRLAKTYKVAVAPRDRERFMQIAEVAMSWGPTSLRSNWLAADSS